MFVIGINNGYTAVFLGFYLYISNITNRHDGILCHHDTNYTRETISDHVSIDCPCHGQYVIFYNERLPGVTYPSGYSNMAYGYLCEVEVYCKYFFLCQKMKCDLSVEICHIVFFFTKVVLILWSKFLSVLNRAHQTVKNVTQTREYV